MEKVETRSAKTPTAVLSCAGAVVMMKNMHIEIWGNSTRKKIQRFSWLGE